ncbi:hypothetical protein [Desulfofustis limnaeus]|uniref:Terminase n=1 Tax=Desulfofustis limnaeus TaxID=2740163 RepID=A0ABM7WAL6_9BACT|nr:hypothetical protein [Desulfofustis limnaeus]BDD88012.1 hypothetical protein DPPLL_23770 [Desulfofustis limnaeus]
MQAYVTRRRDELLSTLLDRMNTTFADEESALEQYQTNPVAFAENVLEESLTGDVKRLMESVRDYPITIARSANATGKTHGAARVAVWFYKSFPGSQVYTAAAPPQANLEKLLWGELGGLIEQHPKLFQNDTTKNLHIERSAQSFITGVSIPLSGTAAQRQAKFSGKHAPHLLFIVDEGDAVPDEIFTAIESCLSGGHGRLLVMFNPRAEQGEVYRMERDGRANIVELTAFNHPNVRTGETVIMGAVDRQTAVRRIQQWSRPLSERERPDSNCFKVPSFLEGATAVDQAGRFLPPLQGGWRKITEPAFSYMVLGRYPAQSARQLISREWIDRARSRWDAYVGQHGEVAPVGTRAKMGLDVGEFGTDANAACFRYGGFVERLVTWSGVDPLMTADRAVEEFLSRDVSRCSVDATGVGAGVAPQMARMGCLAHSVKVASSPNEASELGDFGLLRDQLWWSVREWLRTDSGAMLPPDEQLIEELLCPTYDTEGGKVRIMKKGVMRDLLKRSPDRADALCLTFHEPALLFSFLE